MHTFIRTDLRIERSHHYSTASTNMKALCGNHQKVQFKMFERQLQLWGNDAELDWTLLLKIVEDFALNCISFIAYCHHCAENRD